MKNTNIYISLASALIVLFSSCSKDFLNTPAPNISDESYFSSDGAAISALAGAYDPLSRYDYSQIGEWMIGDVISDDAEKGGEGPGDFAEGQDLKEFRANAENSILATRWSQPYVGINRSNKVIEGVTDNSAITPELRDRIIAEAKFLRAYYHFTISKVFGKIPIVNKVLMPSEFTNPQNEISEVYAQIEQDLKDAMAVLPKKSELATDEMGRATKGAAQSMLVKMYIFQEKWQEASDLADAIIGNGEYSLEPNYADVFTSKGENGVESIFEIQHLSIAGDGSWGDENEGNVTAIFQGSRLLYDENGEITDGWGWGFDCPTQSLYDEFETGDPRLKATIIADGDVVFAGTDDEETVSTSFSGNITGYHSLKYYIPASERNDMSDSPNNWRVIRYADVLLWSAEAKAHLGLDWQTPLNEVRSRATLPNTTNPDGLKAVYHERRVELAMEGHRYFDLVRTGRGDLMDGYTENKRYMPIPQSELSLNPNLVQNPY